MIVNSDTLNDDGQMWEFISAGTSAKYFAIKNKQSGFVLDNFYNEVIIAHTQDISHHHHQWKLLFQPSNLHFIIENTANKHQIPLHKQSENPWVCY